MPGRTHTERFKSLERVLTLIIVVGCGLSLYLATISSLSPDSASFGRMGRGFVLRGGNHETANRVFGSLSRSHDHKDIFHAQKEQRLNKPDPQLPSKTEVSNTVSFPMKMETSIQQWFELPASDKKKDTFNFMAHPHFRDFVIINANVCADTKVDILIYFQSAVDHFQRRRTLRETWANRNTFSNITIRTIFLLGRTKDYLEQMKVHNEFLVYRDIIQGDFIDDTRNLSVKSIMAFRWIVQFCAHARYIIKADDDIFVNIFLLVEKFISTIWESRKVIMCHVRKNGTNPIVRDLKSKWGVPKEIFPNKKFYPRFCPGYAVLFTGDLAPAIYRASFSAPPFPIDDVYTFGMLLEREMGVNFVDLQRNFTLNQKLALEEYTGNKAITHAVSNAWETGVMEKFWFATLERLSPWALRHASFATLEKSRLSLNAQIV